VVSFTIPGTLPSLNQMLKQAQRSPYAYNKLKQDAEATVFLAIRRAGIRELAWPIRLEVDVYAPNRRTDCDNLQAGISKFCLDALVSAGCLPDDSWKHWQMPEPFRYRFYVDGKNPRIEVKIFEKSSGKGLTFWPG